MSTVNYFPLGGQNSGKPITTSRLSQTVALFGQTRDVIHLKVNFSTFESAHFSLNGKRRFLNRRRAQCSTRITGNKPKSLIFLDYLPAAASPIPLEMA
jgi:hypothetical protein